MKVHRRVLRLAGRELTVLTLRPGSSARFATNWFHGTPHVLSDLHGARVLGRLLWALSYDRHPQTIVLLDRLDPNPFDAEPSLPAVFGVAGRTVLDTAVLRGLRRALPLRSPSAGTVRLQTHGLDAAVARSRAYGGPPTAEQMRLFAEQDNQAPMSARATRVAEASGVFVHLAEPELLRTWAVQVARLGDGMRSGMDYAYLHDGARWPTDVGEVQVFADYRARVTAARVARAELLAGRDAPTDPAEIREAVWRRGAAVRSRRLPPVPAAHA
ncbi:hypothetical protein ACQEVB_20730 [Pseudonocardia sp. CA-107938]|uniref:hypothetical protein n=1 Tax=Pseudonocardia sp. CA-107938 TaxID=3240021 RepID=UPI003D8F6EBF